MENLNRVVSSEAEQLILVDGEDREQGHLSKAACHDGAGVLERVQSREGRRLPAVSRATPTALEKISDVAAVMAQHHRR